MTTSTLSFSLLSVALLAGCSFQEPTIDQTTMAEGNVGATCSSHDECVTPMDYLIRSSCPFTSMCIEGHCAVVCPMAFHDPDPEVSESHPVECSADDDCDCGGYVADDMAYCACVDNACVAIVQE